MPKETVSAIVVTKGAGNHIKSCLESLDKQSYPALETKVIDNSVPGRELSYCESLNKGIKESAGDFILCLNDDVILGHDFIIRALGGFSISEDIGMVSGKILRFDKKTIDSTGLFPTLWRTVRERGYGCRDEGQFEDPGYIFGVCGAAAFYRRKMLEEVREGGEYFDERFGFFYEDLDIAWRAQRRGWKGYYVPSAVAYHLRGGTARRAEGIDKKYARRFISDELEAGLFRNRHLTIAKNETTSGFLFRLPLILLYDVFVFFYLLVCRRAVLAKLIIRI